MDGEIWKELPELIEAVIARLPITAFFRFRLVSWKWYGLLHESPSFRKRCAEVTRKEPWLFAKPFFAFATDSLYEPCIRKWYYRRSFSTDMRRSVVASDGGLVCYANHGRKSFSVGNPLLQIWKEFPWPPNSRAGEDNAAMGMVFINKDNYKIVCVDSSGEYEVYDGLVLSTLLGSVTRRTLPGNITLPTLLERTTMTIGTVIYFLRSNPSGILSYDVARDTWGQLLVMTPPNSGEVALAECDGRILLTGFVRDVNATNMCVCVWELDMTTFVWKEVDRMRNSWCSGFSRDKVDVFFRCVSNKRVLVMTLFSHRKDRMFAYDAVSRVWSKVPPCNPPDPYVLPRVDKGIGFFPSLIALP